MAECENEEHEAHAVTKKSQSQSAGNAGCSRQACADKKSDRGVDASGSQPFEHCDLHRIAGRHFLRQVVVDPPAKARSCNGEWSCQPAPRQPSSPRESESAGDDRKHAESDASVEVFAKHEPREKRREDTLEIEQKRRTRCWSPGQSNHQQEGAEQAAEDYRPD